MVDARPAPVAIHRDDLEWAFTRANQMMPFYPEPKRPQSIDRLVSDGDRLQDGGFECEVVATPGHTPGGVCYLFPSEHAVFTGDTLFAGSIGRTDLPGGHSRLLGSSLRRLAALAPETRVYPGHGPATTIAQEVRSNPFLQDTGWASLANA